MDVTVTNPTKPSQYEQALPDIRNKAVEQMRLNPFQIQNTPNSNQNNLMINIATDYNQLKHGSPPLSVPNEQERYYNRLRNSMERQGHLYKNHINNSFIPSKIKITEKYGELLPNNKPYLELFQSTMESPNKFDNNIIDNN